MFANSEDVDYYTNFFYQSKNVLKVFGLWHLEWHMMWTTPLIILQRSILFIFFGVMLYVSTYSSTVYYLKTNDRSSLADALTYSTAIVTFQIKAIIVLFNEKRINGFIKQLESWSYEYHHYENAITNIRKGLKSYQILFWSGEFSYAFTIFTYCFYPVLSGAGRIIPMEPTITFGIDIHETPFYECVLIYQFVGITSNTTICMGFDIMFCGILAITAAVFKNFNQAVKNDLEEISRNFSKLEEWKLKENLLKKRISEYNKFMEFLEKIQETFEISSLIHFYYNYLVMGVCMYQVSKLPFASVRFFSMVGGVLSVAIQLIAYCHFGQEIVNQNQEFWNLLSNCKWYDQSLNFQKMLILTLKRSQNDRYIYAGRIMTLSRETMKKMFQGIFSYYMFLMNFTRK